MHLLTHGVAALWADPGAGKTSITLTAFVALKKAGLAKKLLVIAPLRVCQLVWRQEVMKWSHLNHLKVVLLHGDKKDARLREEADVYLINYEGIPWLADQHWATPLPFDTICADEITKLKNSRSIRFKRLHKLTLRTRRKWGLTGTPAPNGYLDLFGQQLWLDGGAALGKFYTHFRDNFFRPDYDGFNYVLQHNGEARIQEALKDVVYRLTYDNLPAISDHDIHVTLDAKQTKAYQTMKKEMVLNLPEGQVTAGNTAATYAKLKQMANGAVYLSGVPDGPKRPWVELHKAKIDALVDLIDELNKQPLLVAYQYHHDLERIIARLDAEGIKWAHIGSGVSEKDAELIQYRWNRGEIHILLAHPASVGHGLNFQEGGAGHICWFSCDFNLELYDQFIRRIRRQGNDRERVINHRLIVLGTIDELVYEALEIKDTTQARLLRAVMRVLKPQPAGDEADQPETNLMSIRRVGAQGGAPAAPAAPVQPQTTRTVAPPGGAGLSGWQGQATAAQPASNQPTQAKLSRVPVQPTQAAPVAPTGAPVRRPVGPAPSYVAPQPTAVDDEGEEFNPMAAASQMFANAMGGTAAQEEADATPEEVAATPAQQAIQTGAGRPEATPTTTKRRTTAKPAAADLQGMDNQTGPSAGPAALAQPQHVHLSFSGSPAQVAESMAAFVAAIKASF